MFRTVGRYVPPPQGVLPAVAWGREERVRELLGRHCDDVEITRETCAMRFPSAHACVDFFRTWYGPTVAAFSAVDESVRPQLEAELAAVYEAHNGTSDGTLAMDVPYLEVVAARA